MKAEPWEMLLDRESKSHLPHKALRKRKGSGKLCLSPQTILHKGNAPSPIVDLQEVLLSLPVIDATAVSLSLRGTVNELRGLQSIRMTASQESFFHSPGLGCLGTATYPLS